MSDRGDFIKENKLADYLAQIGELRDQAFQSRLTLVSHAPQVRAAATANANRAGAFAHSA
jgi:hypothetical protein